LPLTYSLIILHFTDLPQKYKNFSYMIILLQFLLEFIVAKPPYNSII